MSLNTRSIRPHSRATFPRTSPSLPRALRSPQIVFALAITALSACADRVTDPTSSMTLSRSSASAERSGFPTTLASVGWQDQARLLVASRRLSPIDATRAYALLGVAQYGAVVDADKRLGADGLLKDGSGFGEGGRSRFEARRGAVAGASAQILSYLFPAVVLPASGTFPGASFPAAAAELEQRLSSEGRAGPGGVHPHFTLGVAIGREWGDRMIAWARSDGYSNAWTGTIPVGAGYWTRNPAPPGGSLPPLAGPQFGAMKPYFLTSPGQFHPPTPPAFGSAAYLVDLAEVSLISATRTPAQLLAAQTLNLNVGSITTLGRFDEFATDYILADGLDERAAAHVFALTNAATMDAVIGCWEAKFTIFYIRPYQANTAITTPIGMPNHPSYPSGHSCVSAAAAEIIKAFFPEAARVAALDAQVIANGESRIYAGIHFRFDVTAGQALGRAVARTALAYDRTNGLLAAVP